MKIYRVFIEMFALMLLIVIALLVLIGTDYIGNIQYWGYSLDGQFDTGENYIHILDKNNLQKDSDKNYEELSKEYIINIHDEKIWKVKKYTKNDIEHYNIDCERIAKSDLKYVIDVIANLDNLKGVTPDDLDADTRINYKYTISINNKVVKIPYDSRIYELLY